MQRIAFRMVLLKGFEKEYQARHDAIWPELKQLLKETGITDYSIFLDEETNHLLGILKIRDGLEMGELSQHPVMQKWWSYLKDIMETNEDNSPVSIPLKEVFYLE